MVWSVDRLILKLFIKVIFFDFIELYGDCFYGDDEVIVGGLVIFNDILVMVIVEEKGIDI